jgi:sigma-54-specific transcriptional regulator
MSCWLSYTTELVGVRKPQQLAQMFVGTLQHELAIDSCLLLAPDVDGRTLVPCNKGIEMVWSVTDFDCPFAHVLQTAQPMSILMEDLVFWQSNKSFAQLVQSVGLFQSVRIEPFPQKNTTVKLLLFMIGETDTLKKFDSDGSLRRYIEAFNQQWSLLMDMQYEEKSQQNLRESLCDIKRGQRQQRKIDALSQVRSDKVNRLLN